MVQRRWELCSKSKISYALHLARSIDITYLGKTLTGSFTKVRLLNFELLMLNFESDIASITESQKLPEILQEWLFPLDGTPRHLPSLQVSLGSNDEFFASDRFGKISSRESNSPAEESQTTPKLAEVGSTFMRRKAYTISSPIMRKSFEPYTDSVRQERRKTSMGTPLTPNRDSKLTRIPRRETLLTHLDTKTDMEPVAHKRGKSLLIGPPSVRPLWPDIRTILMAKERLKTQELQDTASAPRGYVDAGVQTELPKIEDCLLSEPVRSYLPPQHQISIGSMQDFCRAQYRLGDALLYHGNLDTWTHVTCAAFARAGSASTQARLRSAHPPRQKSLLLNF